MAAGSDPLLIAIRDKLADEIETIDKVAEGYHFNYGPVGKGTMAWVGKGYDPNRPRPHLLWLGPTPGPDYDAIGGNERGYRTVRRFDRWALSFVVVAPDGDHEAMAWKIEQDIEVRLRAASRRNLGHTTSNNLGRPLVTLLNSEWFPGAFGQDSDGGLLVMHLVVRWEHMSGDMSLGGN